MVTAAGAEALPFLASFCVLPASLLFFFAYGTTRFGLSMGSETLLVLMCVLCCDALVLRSWMADVGTYAFRFLQ